MAKKVVSERVVSTKVIKKPNLISKYQSKFQKVGMSIKSFFSAFLFLLAAIVVIFISEKFNRKSEVVVDLPLEQAENVTAGEGLHKMQGSVKISKKLTAPEVGDVLYYDLTVEEYKEVEKTETEVRTTIVDGQEVEQTVEKTVLEDEWVEVASDSAKWADFSIGKYKVVPDSASKRIDYMSNEYWLDEELNEYVLLEDGMSITPILGDQRMIVTYLPVDSTMLVIGDITTGPNGKTVVKSGETFIVSNKSDADLLESLESSENTTFWIYKIVAFILLFTGLKGIMGPLLALLDFIPLVGKAADKMASVIAAIVSLIVVVFLSIVIRYFWLFILIPVAMFAIAMYKAGQHVPEVKEEK